MADITKCTGEGCPLKETCYRFTAPTDMYQSFFVAYLSSTANVNTIGVKPHNQHTTN